MTIRPARVDFWGYREDKFWVYFTSRRLIIVALDAPAKTQLEAWLDSNTPSIKLDPAKYTVEGF